MKVRGRIGNIIMDLLNRTSRPLNVIEIRTILFKEGFQLSNAQVLGSLRGMLKCEHVERVTTSKIDPHLSSFIARRTKQPTVRALEFRPLRSWPPAIPPIQRSGGNHAAPPDIHKHIVSLHTIYDNASESN